MDINNQQQTNTFVGGMDTDTSDMYLDSSKYRYAENVRLVTDKDSNSGELRLIDGTKLICNISSPNGNGTSTEYENCDILEMTSVRDLGVLILKNNLNKWRIVTFDKTGAITPKTGWIDECIWNTHTVNNVQVWDGKKNLSTVIRWEAEDNIKLYIADGIHNLMVINLHDDNSLKTSFDSLFGAQTVLLPPVDVELVDSSATIPGVLVQYGYVLYAPKGESSTLSVLSDFLQIGKTASMGYNYGENGGKAVEITLPTMVTDSNIRVYRISYSAAGQLPRVDVIYDQKYSAATITDVGQSIENVSSAEFIATNKLSIIPKEIESKGDLLFAANVQYGEDDVNEKFANFDARCFSSGNYISGENGDDYVLDHIDDANFIRGIDPQQLKHKQFDASNSEYNYLYWYKNANHTVLGGKGLCFEWTYNDQDQIIDVDGKKRTSDVSESPRTYLRGEVYRFGVRLFDEKGRASSVKWIADIKIPDYNYDFLVSNSGGKKWTCTRYTINFTPINTSADYWQNVAAYEIVQCKRSFEDSYRIAQGIVGFPQKITDDTICTPYVLSTYEFHTTLGQAKLKTTSATADVAIPYAGTDCTDTMLFACPESTYQSDDIQNIIKNNKSSLNYKTDFELNAESYFNHVTGTYVVDQGIAGGNPYMDFETYARNIINTPENRGNTFTDVSTTASKDFVGTQDLTNPNTGALHIGVCEYHPFLSGSNIRYYYISPQTYCRGIKKNLKVSNRVHAYTSDVVRPGGYGQSVGHTSIKINNAYFSDGVKQSTMTSDDKITVRNTYTQVGEKQYFPWTNPALVSYQNYLMTATEQNESMFNITKAWIGRGDEHERWTGGGPDDDPRIPYKPYMWITAQPAWFHRQFPLTISCIPTSNGGRIMILDPGQDVSPRFNRDPLKSTDPIDQEAYSYYFPPITVGRLYKSATPYGGYNAQAIEKSQYISIGKFQTDKTQTVEADKGDGFISLFTYNLCHNTLSNYYTNLSSAQVVYQVPIETTIDLSQQGSEYLYKTATTGNATDDQTLGEWFQSEPDSVYNLNQTSSAYIYNTAYSVLPDVVSYSGEVNTVKTSNNYDSRVHNSLPKSNNELIDSWTTFKSADFTDVDSRYGQITGLKLFKDKLIFLQEGAAGVLSVNDRTIVKDESSANIIVGSAGVLDRFDYFTTIYGMKPEQHAIEISNDALYWWDGHHKEIIHYQDGYNVNLLQRVKNVSNYINSGTESTLPTIMFDPKNKEVLFNVVNDKALVYNEQTQQFTSVYTFNPEFYCRLNEDIFTTQQCKEYTSNNVHYKINPTIYEYNSRESDCQLFGYYALPLVKYTVNKDPLYNKVFDIQTFGGRFYGGEDYGNITDMAFTYSTPLKQHSQTGGSKLTNREYDFRLAIPRNNNDAYGGRMRGKFMNCVISSDSSDFDFSLQYVTTKYRMSWS